MVFWAPLTDNQNKNFFTNMKIKQTTLRCNTKQLQGINPIVLCAPWCPFGRHLPTQLQTLRT